MTDPWPFAVGFEFQKCKPYRADVQEMLRASASAENRTVVEEKLDGWRALLTRDLEGVLHLYSRGVSVTGERIDLLTKFGSVPCLGDIMVTKGDAIEGELLYPGHRAAEVPSALKEADTRRSLVFSAFGHPYDAGTRVPTLWRQYELIESLECPRAKVFSYGAHLMSPTELSNFAARHGVEGWVIKEFDQPNGRWWKLKREHTMDVIVVDTKEGKGKYEGVIGAFIVGVIDDANGEWSLTLDDGTAIRVREIASVSGMEDDERNADPASLVGRVCEIECQAVGQMTGGRLRHPRFIRWREDKPATECRGQDFICSGGPD